MNPQCIHRSISIDRSCRARKAMKWMRVRMSQDLPRWDGDGRGCSREATVTRLGQVTKFYVLFVIRSPSQCCAAIISYICCAPVRLSWSRFQQHTSARFQYNSTAQSSSKRQQWFSRSIRLIFYVICRNLFLQEVVVSFETFLILLWATITSTFLAVKQWFH